MFDFIEADDVVGLIAHLQALEDDTASEVLKTKDSAGRSLLHSAVSKGSLEMVRTLLVAGSPVNEIDSQGNTPLHLAITGNIDIIKELIDFDASLLVPDAAGKTALEIVEAMRKGAGADIKNARLAALLRTRQKWQEEGVGFRFNRVVGMLKKIEDSVKPANGKNKLFFIGGTGTGKSTLLNYLNGTQYDVMYNEAGGIYAERCGGAPEIAKTGQSMISQTLYPQIIQNPDLPFVYCDLAGLFDTKGPEERICAASSVQVLSRLSGKIKGIAVLLDIPGFEANRAAAFKKTAVALARIARDDKTIMDSVTFVITKTPIGAVVKPEAIIRRYVKGILYSKDGLEDQAQERGLDEEEEALRFMLHEMEYREKQILIADFREQNKFRTYLEDKFKSMSAKDSKCYNFNQQDGSQTSFYDLLSTIAESYSLGVSKIRHEIPGMLHFEIERQKEITARIGALRAEIARINDALAKPFDPASIDTEIGAKEKLLAEKRAESKTKTENIVKRNSEIAKLQDERSPLDNNGMILVEKVNRTYPNHPNSVTFDYISKYALDRISTSYSGWGQFSCELIKPRPLGITERDERDGEICSIYDFDEDARNGIYQEIFRASMGMISIENIFYTQSKYKYAARIKEIKDAIAVKEKQNKEDTEDIKRLAKEIKNLVDQILKCKVAREQSKSTSQINAIRLNTELLAATSALEAAQIGLNLCNDAIASLTEQKSDLELELSVNEDLYAVVYKLSHTLGLDNHQGIKRFWRDYEGARASNAIIFSSDPRQHVAITRVASIAQVSSTGGPICKLG